MPRFDDYLQEVQVRSGLRPIPLIRAWQRREKTIIAWSIRHAIRQSGIIGGVIPNFAGTNQSKGNQAATHFYNTMRANLPQGAALTIAAGKGYPDLLLSVAGVGYGMELKATSEWKPRDTNRRVLTSSPTKMRTLIRNGDLGNPPAHFICYVLYDKVGATVDGIRLDFLEPDSIISIRLEASTSHRALSNGNHTTRVFS